MPAVTLTWHASKYKVNRLQQRYTLYISGIYKVKDVFVNGRNWVIICTQ